MRPCIEDNTPAQHDVYILHFNARYWGNSRHYTGYTSLGVKERLLRHRAGKGSQLVKFALDKGIDFEVGLVEHGYPNKMIARMRERQLKKEGHLSRHCVVCQRNKARMSEVKKEVANGTTPDQG